MTDDRIAGLRRALDRDPANHALRAMLADMLEQAGRTDEALEQHRILLEAGRLPKERLAGVGMGAAAAGHLDLATRCLEEAKRSGVIDGVQALQERLDAQRAQRGVLRLVRPAPAAAESEEPPAAEMERKVTFAEVGGLESVKKTIHRMIVLPFLRPGLYAAYGRRSGGGVMLYGPPGCGKTMLARATAGECGVPFINVRIEEVLDPYFGVSESKLHQTFEKARRLSPCVLFVDEVDAIGFSRRKQHGGAARGLVDQLLQELDAIGSDNQELLILGATNAPWDVDDALKRPGRFDRVIFIAPPDQPARREILKLLLAGRLGEGLDLDRIAGATPLFSGADLRAMVESAVDRVIEEALEQGGTPPLRHEHLEAARAQVRPSAVDWLERARNYVEFGNHDRRYDDVAAFLRTPEAKKHLR